MVSRFHATPKLRWTWLVSAGLGGLGLFEDPGKMCPQLGGCGEEAVEAPSLGSSKPTFFHANRQTRV